MEFLDEVYWNNSVKSYLVSIGIVVTSVVVAVLLRRLCRSWFKDLAEKTTTKLDDILLELIERPLIWLVVILGLFSGLNVLSLPEWLGSLLHKGMVLATALVVALALSRLIEIIFKEYIEKLASRTESRLDDQVLPVLRKTSKAALWIMAVVIVLDNFGYDVMALITGLGLGGLALAMASKDTLSNILGGFTIFMDRPFEVGDAVSVKGVKGSVEEVGLRATRIRTYDGALVTIPNSSAADSVIENISARPTMRVLFKLGLVYDTPADKCRKAVELIGKVIEEAEGTCREPSVHFVAFGDSALEYQVIYHVETSASLLEVKHAVNLGIKEAIETEGIGMAFPTVTIDAPGLKVGV